MSSTGHQCGVLNDERCHAGWRCHSCQLPLVCCLVCCCRFETTAHSIAWTLYEIASNPDVQDKVGAGLCATLTRAGGRLQRHVVGCEAAVPSPRNYDEHCHALCQTLPPPCPPHPAQLEAELAAAGLLGSDARPLEFGDLNALAYLNAVLKEAMRLHPVASTGTVR